MIFDKKMTKSGEILKYRFVNGSDQTSWRYVFKDKESYIKWYQTIHKFNFFSEKDLPKNLKYSEKESFLNPLELFLV